MAKTWILDTETKGTGAHIAPLEPESARAERELATVTFDRPPRPAEAPEPPAPRTFKVVDVMSARVLTEGADTRETLELLAGMRSALDARIYTWVPSVERWRLLTLGERRALWEMREMREMRGQGHHDRIPAREDGIAIVVQDEDVKGEDVTAAE
jgi:hypothetical protein